MQNEAYLFERAYGEGESLDEARQKCFVNLTTKLEHERGITISSKFRASSHLSRDTYTKSKDFSMECEENGKSIFLNCRTVDEYWTNDHGHYSCSLLYSIANNAYPDRAGDMAYVTSHYGARGLWRSAIVPGWGQLYKGSTVKGGLIMGGTAVLVGGIVFTECMRSDYADKIAKTRKEENKRIYATRRNNFSTGRNICIGALGALYIYNLIDAIVAPGARRVLVKERPGGGSYAIAPSITSEGYPAMSCSITF